ncbi:DUF5329 family protein [Aeoliella sp. SH292]|uniref:DUF5329 family protein n=1 Tax=Aeoliella sp. SH292 TaxID=3454464 RepID=UPI003F98CD7E
MNLRIVILVLIAIAWMGCSRSSTPVSQLPSKSKSLAIAGLPVQLTVNQRSTTEIPGSGGKLSVTVDDVTRGQTMVSIVRTGDAPLLGPASMKQGDIQEFQIDGVRYTLQLTQLNNALVGEDTAALTFDTSSGKTLSDSDKIELLIQHVHAMEGAVFIRNGTQHTPREAAEHMREKWNAAGDKLKSASDFIEHVASRSSLTGEVYQIRTADGRTTPAGEMLRDHLAAIERGE